MSALALSSVSLPSLNGRLSSQSRHIALRCVLKSHIGGTRSNLRACALASNLHSINSRRFSQTLKVEHDVPQPADGDLQLAKPQYPATSPAAVASEDDDAPAWLRFGRQCGKGALVFGMAMALALAPMIGSADAARSSGRMGGSSFSAARSGGSSYGGGGYTGGSSFGGARSSGSSYSSSYGSGGQSSFGGGRSYSSYPSYSSPSVVIRPQPSFAFGFGGFGEQPFAGGVSVPVVQSSSGFGGGGLIAILGLGLLAFVLFQAFGDNLEDEPGSGNGTVVKLSVALTSSARSLQHEMERIAKRADTNDSEGLHYVLQETVLALLRHPEYCEYATSSKKNVRSLDEAEETFNEASMEERSKYQEETLSNVSGRTKNDTNNGKWSSSASSKGPGDDLIVVTILVATDGAVNVQKVNSNETLKAALNKLGGVRSEQVMAVEVIWTPGDDADSYTRDEMMMEFPQMSNL